MAEPVVAKVDPQSGTSNAEYITSIVEVTDPTTGASGYEPNANGQGVAELQHAEYTANVEPVVQVEQVASVFAAVGSGNPAAAVGAIVAPTVSSIGQPGGPGMPAAPGVPTTPAAAQAQLQVPAPSGSFRLPVGVIALSVILVVLLVIAVKEA